MARSHETNENSPKRQSRISGFGAALNRIVDKAGEGMTAGKVGSVAHIDELRARIHNDTNQRGIVTHDHPYSASLMQAPIASSPNKQGGSQYLAQLIIAGRTVFGVVEQENAREEFTGAQVVVLPYGKNLLRPEGGDYITPHKLVANYNAKNAAHDQASYRIGRSSGIEDPQIKHDFDVTITRGGLLVVAQTSHETGTYVLDAMSKSPSQGLADPAALSSFDRLITDLQADPDIWNPSLARRPQVSYTHDGQHGSLN